MYTSNEYTFMATRSLTHTLTRTVTDSLTYWLTLIHSPTCSWNPLLMLVVGLFRCTNSTHLSKHQPLLLIKYATTNAAERLRPARQCTNTPPASNP